MAYTIEDINGVTKLKDTTLGTIVYNFDLATIVVQNDDIQVFQDVQNNFNLSEVTSGLNGADAETAIDNLAKSNLFKTSTTKNLDAFGRLRTSDTAQRLDVEFKYNGEEFLIVDSVNNTVPTNLMNLFDLINSLR